MMWGISQKTNFPICSFERAWGISSMNQYYPTDVDLISNYNKIDTRHFNNGNSEVDILFDCDKRELKICLVGQSNKKKEAKIWDIKYKDDDKYGFVPHLNFCRYGLQV